MCKVHEGKVQSLSLWQPGEGLSDRVRRLREEYFSYETRSFKNEVLPFSTGTRWDTVYARSHWTNVPEMMPFLPAFEDSLLAAARVVPLPDDFWRHSLSYRAALFFSELPIYQD